jgi:preprotein translocase SecE subunit
MTYSVKTQRITWLLKILMASVAYYSLYSMVFFISVTYVGTNIHNIFSLQNAYSLYAIHGVTIFVVGCAWIYITINKSIANYLLSVGEEGSKIDWPSTKDTNAKYVVVISVVAISALFLFILDAFWLKIINTIIMIGNNINK